MLRDIPAGYSANVAVVDGEPGQASAGRLPRRPGSRTSTWAASPGWAAFTGGFSCTPWKPPQPPSRRCRYRLGHGHSPYPGDRPLDLAGLTALGVALRFSTLGLQGYHHDEVITTRRVISGSFAHMLHEVKVSESNPPLYYALAWGSAKLFGNAEFGLLPPRRPVRRRHHPGRLPRRR